MYIQCTCTCVYMYVHVHAMCENIQYTVLYIGYSTFDDGHIHVHTYGHF